MSRPKEKARRRASPRRTASSRPEDSTPSGSEESVEERIARLPLALKLLLSVLPLVVIIAAVEGLLAVAGVRPILVDEDPYVGFQSSIRLFEPTASGDELRTAPGKLALFNHQQFPRHKSANAYRVFTLGGSTTYGRPFDDPTSFTGWLRLYLRTLQPARDWQVINAGGISYASYRVATLMEELIEYQPDLFIIYSGNNEFLEKRTYQGLIEEPAALTRTRLLLQRLRIWTVGRRLARAAKGRAENKFEMAGEVEELLDSSAGLDYYFRDDNFTAQVLDHYRFNLLRMVQLARASGAEVMLITIPVNEKDFAPFKSQHRDRLTEAERATHARLMSQAAAALEDADFERARSTATDAVELDPRFSESHYLLGRALQALGDYDRAAAAFASAISEDVCPLRALPEINQSIAAAAGGGVELVDFRRLLRHEMAESFRHSNLGEEYFLDHVHPTVEANGLLARALIDRMAAMGIVERQADLSGIHEQVQAEVLSQVDAEDYAKAYKNLSKVLIWAGKKKEAERYVRQAAAVMGDDWEIRYNQGVLEFEAGRLEDAARSFREAIHLNPGAAAAHDRLASVYAELGDLEAAVAAGRQAVAADPRRAGPWNNLGTVYLSTGDPASAGEAIRRALEIEPDFAEAHNNLGNVQFAQGDLQAASSSYQRAEALRPNYTEAMVNQGLVEGEMGRFGAALDQFSRALELDGRLVSAHAGRGKALIGLGDLDEAIASFQRAVELYPADREARGLLVRSLVSAGRRARAYEVLEDGLRTDPASAAWVHLRGRLLAEDGRLQRAGESFQRALELDAEWVDASLDLANLRLIEGRPTAARRILEDALSRNEADDRLHHSLARNLLMSGQLKEATAHLERALQLNPDNAPAARDLAQIQQQQNP